MPHDMALPTTSSPVRSARLLRGGAPVEFTTNNYGILLKLPARSGEEIDQVIVLELGAAK